MQSRPPAQPTQYILGGRGCGISQMHEEQSFGLRLGALVFLRP